MPKGTFWRFTSPAFAAEATRQALAFEARPRGAPIAEGKTLADVIADISDGSRTAAFIASDQAFVFAEMRETHALINCPTDPGKTSFVHMLLVHEICDAAQRALNATQESGADLDTVPRDLEVLIVDPKDTPMLREEKGRDA